MNKMYVVFEKSPPVIQQAQFRMKILIWSLSSSAAFQWFRDTFTDVDIIQNGLWNITVTP